MKCHVTLHMVVCGGNAAGRAAAGVAATARALAA